MLHHPSNFPQLPLKIHHLFLSPLVSQAPPNHLHPISFSGKTAFGLYKGTLFSTAQTAQVHFDLQVVSTRPHPDILNNLPPPPAVYLGQS